MAGHKYLICTDTTTGLSGWVTVFLSNFCPIPKLRTRLGTGRIAEFGLVGWFGSFYCEGYKVSPQSFTTNDTKSREGNPGRQDLRHTSYPWWFTFFLFRRQTDP